MLCRMSFYRFSTRQDRSRLKVSFSYNVLRAFFSLLLCVGLEDSQTKRQSFSSVVAQDKIQTPVIVSAPEAEVLANAGPGSVAEAVPVAESQLNVENAPKKSIPVSDHGSNISQSGRSSQSTGDDLKVGVPPPEERMETEAAENNSADDELTEVKNQPSLLYQS